MRRKLGVNPCDQFTPGNAAFPLLDRFPQSEGAERVAGIPAHRAEIHKDALAEAMVQTGTEVFACG